MIRVFYDGKCGLCSREIAYYRRIAPAGIFQWYDIAHDPSSLEPLDISQAMALKLLHVEDDANQMHIGVDAFLVIWRQLQGWRFLALLVGLPGVRHAANLAYRRFAQWRFHRLPHCQLAKNKERNNP